MALLLLFPTTTKLYQAESILKSKNILAEVIVLPELETEIGDSCGELGLLIEDISVKNFFESSKLIEVADELIG